MEYVETTGRVASFRKTKFLALLATSSVLAGWASQAFADDAQIERLQAEIHRVEARQQAEISSLRAEIHHLKHGGGPIYVTKGEPVPNGGPHVIETTKAGVHFGFADLDQQNTVELTGRLHIDTGGYVGVTPNVAAPIAPGSGPSPSKAGIPFQGYASGINFRRARIGVQGIFLGDWSYGLIFDMGGSSDGFTSTGGAGGGTLLNGGIGSGIENAFITYNGLYKHGGPIPVAFDIGAIDVPWTLDESISSNDIMFMERSSPQVIATGFGGGDNRTAIGMRSNNDRYWFGAYLTGPTTGAIHTGTAPTGGPAGFNWGPQFASLVRGSYQIFQDKATNGSLHIGFNFADTFEPRAASTGAYGEGISLSNQPELRVDPTNVLATGTVPAHNAQVFGAEAAASYGNAFIQGEYYHYIIDTRSSATTFVAANGPAVAFNGGYVQGSYTFGGRRYYKPTSGSYSGVIPDRPFIIGTDGWGALELAGRFSIVDLNSATTFGGLPSNGGTQILGGKQTAFGGGVNWYPNGNMKFMLDYEHLNEYVPAAFGGANTYGGQINWIAARSEFFF